MKKCAVCEWLAVNFPDQYRELVTDASIFQGSMVAHARASWLMLERIEALEKERREIFEEAHPNFGLGDILS